MLGVPDAAFADGLNIPIVRDLSAYSMLTSFPAAYIELSRFERKSSFCRSEGSSLLVFTLARRLSSGARRILCFLGSLSATVLDGAPKTLCISRSL